MLYMKLATPKELATNNVMQQIRALQNFTKLDLAPLLRALWVDFCLRAT